MNRQSFSSLAQSRPGSTNVFCDEPQSKYLGVPVVHHNSLLSSDTIVSIDNVQANPDPIKFICGNKFKFHASFVKCISYTVVFYFLNYFKNIYALSLAFLAYTKINNQSDMNHSLLLLI